MSTEEPLPEGSQVSLHFLLPNGRAIEALGEVLWARPTGGSEKPGMGVQFVNLSPEDQSDLRLLLEPAPASSRG